MTINPNMEPRWWFRASTTGWAWACVPALVLLGCNRLPTAKVELAALLPNVSELSDDEGEDSEAPRRAQPPASMTELCANACDHYIRMRYAEPVGMDQVSVSAGGASAAELLKKQQDFNREGCARACRDRNARARALCVLEKATPEDAEGCIAGH